MMLNRCLPLAALTLLLMTGCGGESAGFDNGSTPQDSNREGVVLLEWRMPDHRENGDYLEDHEIGGYELRFRAAGEREYQRLTINDGLVTSYSLPLQDLSDYTIEIATFDTDGLYSRYVALTPVEVIH